MPERFSETLRAASEPGWSLAVGHRFVKELFTGAVPDPVMARYLIQGHRFLDSFLTLLGAALASADMFEVRLRFGRFIGIMSGEENTYFLRAFEALGVTEDRRAADPDTQPTAAFKAIMREAAETRSYAAALSVLVVAEWLYLDWASRAPQSPPDNFVLRQLSLWRLAAPSRGWLGPLWRAPVSSASRDSAYPARGSTHGRTVQGAHLALAATRGNRATRGGAPAARNCVREIALPGGPRAGAANRSSPLIGRCPARIVARSISASGRHDGGFLYE